jgi:hypothetical protein
MNIHYEILDEQRMNVLPKLTMFRELGFYLAGGTALALQIGHRDSIDFDFFCLDSFDTTILFTKIEQKCSGHTIVRLQDEQNTLEILVDGTIRLSFMTYKYPLIEPAISTEFFDLASMIDIGCMKLSAITSRTAYKDYVDLYFILQQRSLAELINNLQVKLPTLDPSLALKSLVYFDDILPEEILYKITPINIKEIKSFLLEQVKIYNN